MIQTLHDVFENRDDILQRLDLEKERYTRIDSPFDRSQMDSVLVLPDKVARTFLEIDYVFDTHFIPNGLPASGEAIGDFLEHKDKTYLTMHLGVMIHNSMAFHLIRESESLYREWFKQRDGFNHKVQDLLAEIRKADKDCFGIEVFQGSEKWNESYVGWGYLGTPSIEFLEALKSLSEVEDIFGSTVVETAIMLEAELKPYVVLQKTMENIRKKADHKGFPRLKEDMFYLSTPAASGGASFHTHWADDDIRTALPSSNDLMLIAAQAGTIGITHIGAGSVEGKHIIFVPPKIPFLKTVQERISADAELQTSWTKLVSGDMELQEAAFQWVYATKPIKIKEVVPDLISSRVLGLQLDLISEHRVAHLRPVITQSLLEKERDVVDEYGCQVIFKEIEDVLLDTGNGFGQYKSVF